MSVLKIKDNNSDWVQIPTIKGETGDAAGFGTVTATVDANHGTPAVSVTATGDDTAKNFAFAFSNLQPAPYDDSVLVARMDSFTNLAEGSTTGDAELIDGRTGADGVTYTNIGGAIRGQVTDLKNTLYANLGIAGPNFFDSTNKLNAYINGSLVIKANAGNRVGWAKLQPNTKYNLSISKKANTDFVLVFCNNVPAADVQGTNAYWEDVSATSVDYTFTTDSEYTYIAFKYWSTDATTYTEQDVLGSITLKLLESIGEQVSDLETAVTTGINGVQFIGNTFTIPANTYHSSSKDTIKVDIKAGEKIYVGTNAFMSQIWVNFSDGTSANIFGIYEDSPMFRPYTTEKDIVSIGLGYENTDESSIVVHLCVAKSPMASWVIDQLNGKAGASDVNAVWTRIASSPFNGVRFTVPANTYHSADNDRLNVDIKAGESFYVGTNLLQSQIWVKYSDNTSQNIFGIYDESAMFRKFTTAKDIVSIGLGYENTSASSVLGWLCVSVGTMSNWVVEKVYNLISLIPYDETPNVFGTNSAKTYASYFNESEEVDTFFFFSDPHTLGDSGNLNLAKLKRDFEILKAHADESNPATIISGGDWLNSYDTKDQACYKLRLLSGMSKKYLSDYNYHLVLGNHDTNYQGKEDASAEVGTGTLTQQTLNNLLFLNENTKKAYYTYTTPNTKYYVFDTGIDWSPALNAYRQEQLNWFCEQLESDESKNIVVLMHIFSNSPTSAADFAESITPMATEIVAIIKAFNNRSSITQDGISYSFSGRTGIIRCILSGHVHFDTVYIADGNLPVVAIDDATDMVTVDVRFDMGFFDYTNNQLKLVRVGGGDDRVVTLKS